MSNDDSLVVLSDNNCFGIVYHGRLAFDKSWWKRVPMYNQLVGNVELPSILLPARL